jgi:CRISPR system Cascade subunit CasC
MAAHNFPSYAMAVVRNTGQPLSLANAFLKPARPRGEDVDLVDDSIKKLEAYATKLRSALGVADWMSWDDRDLAGDDNLPTRLKTLADLYARVADRALNGQPS